MYVIQNLFLKNLYILEILPTEHMQNIFLLSFLPHLFFFLKEKCIISLCGYTIAYLTIPSR